MNRIKDVVDMAPIPDEVHVVASDDSKIEIILDNSSTVGLSSLEHQNHGQEAIS